MRNVSSVVSNGKACKKDSLAPTRVKNQRASIGPIGALSMDLQGGLELVFSQIVESHPYLVLQVEFIPTAVAKLVEH